MSGAVPRKPSQIGGKIVEIGGPRQDDEQRPRATASASAATASADDEPQAPSTAALSPRARAAATSAKPSLCNNLGTRSVRAAATIGPVAAIEGIVTFRRVLRTPQPVFNLSVAANPRRNWASGGCQPAGSTRRAASASWPVFFPISRSHTLSGERNSSPAMVSPYLPSSGHGHAICQSEAEFAHSKTVPLRESLSSISCTGFRPTPPTRNTLMERRDFLKTIRSARPSRPLPRIC